MPDMSLGLQRVRHNWVTEEQQLALLPVSFSSRSLKNAWKTRVLDIPSRNQLELLRVVVSRKLVF